MVVGQREASTGEVHRFAVQIVRIDPTFEARTLGRKAHM
jgi:hypothetical protein